MDGTGSSAGDTQATNLTHLAHLAQPVQTLPPGEDFLLWSPCQQVVGYRHVDRLFATRSFKAGPQPRTLPRGPALHTRYIFEGRSHSIDDFMQRNNSAGLLVLHRGQVRLERYALDLQPHQRWSTMSTVKSMTAMLVGAAVHEGAISSVDDPVERYLPTMAGTAYAGVTVRHLLTMSSGVRWSEDYTDRQSDVNRYSKSLADKVPGGVMRLLRELSRAHAPGSTWAYNTGDTYLLGALLSAAVGMPLAHYMATRLWQPFGMEFDGYYTLESDEGQEIGGSRAGMALRDVGRFALFVLEDGTAAGRRVLPEGWIDQVASRAFDIPRQLSSPSRRALGLTGYGYSWWLRDDSALMALGHAGQRIFIDRRADFALVSLAVYPEPGYVSPADHDRDAELAALIAALRADVSG